MNFLLKEIQIFSLSIFLHCLILENIFILVYICILHAIFIIIAHVWLQTCCAFNKFDILQLLACKVLKYFVINQNKILTLFFEL